MTTFARTQIPLSVNTVEKLYAWAGTLLDAMNPTLRTLEDENVSEKATQLVVKPSILAGPLFIARITLPLNSNHASSTDPFWLNVTELSNTAIPASWTAGS
jgi:hypothetical protein